jgi:Zn-dependent metalloprotease
MSNFLKPIGLVVIAALTTTLSFGQTKQQTVPNLTSPFQNKTVKSSSTVITPSSNNKRSPEKPKIEIKNGSFFIDLKKERQPNKSVSSNFNSLFELNAQHTFQQMTEKTDKLGFTHANFQQFYKGYPIDGNLIMVHSKNGITNSINGNLAKFGNIETQIVISKTEAKNIAKNYLKVTELITDYPIETVITQIPTEKGVDTRLAYKVRIDSYTPFEMCNIFIDTKTGEIINKINLVAHADTPGTAQTLYSATQNITCDSYSGSYRLRESGRNIETYNATNATGITTGGFTGSTDFTSSSTSWTGVPKLSSFTISTVAQSWWYTIFADATPDLYIKIKDGSNQTVYTSGYYDNTNPPVTFNNLNLLLTNPPYTAEIWDYDVTNADDFGGSYAISTSSGTQSWSGSGNNGTYLISVLGNPALDVHWGMEETYDFYLNVFSRNSYDGSGSIIKQYINSPLTQPNQGGDPNNAFAMNSPYNIMVYGMGDGTLMSPVVGLDVEGHEFTHMVVNNNGNGGLTYQGESGALNESFADIMGTCVEFYSGVNPDWNIGEDVVVSASNLRSMSNPNNPTGLSQQPDTYNGTYWANPADTTNDNGGVHINSGVQNFWFYLLSQGGSGTNDIGNAYSVTGIGIADARQIAYRNLVTYLTPNATYVDAYNGALQSAEDLYGNPSTQYTSVRQAWYAVGIGNDPNNYCSGTTNLTAPSGTVTDGSGTASYENNANCKWVIKPAGATQIQLTFTAFDTEASYDTVFVYDGPDETFPVLATWWGNTLPPVINTTSGIGAMCIRFTSDNTVTAGGWSANYQAFGTNPYCDGGTSLSSPSGSFSDGSGGNNYGNNYGCYWFIAPPCASSVTLSFSAFDTELNYDGVVIYDDLTGTNQIAVLTGTTLPSSVTSTTGIMTVVFVSDYSTTGQGFSANYTSTGSAYCSGTTTINTSDYGTVTDGSSGNNYCNNQDCEWLIQPPNATSVTLNFTAFDLEDASTDGNTIYDAVEIYDGATTGATLLGTFTGNNIPQTLTSSGGSLLIRFYSDLVTNKQGWSANYTSTQSTYCTGSTTLTAQNGTFNDGSGGNQYANNSDCSWLIQPPSATSITLSFSSFNTELNNDGVIVYDGANNTASVLGQFSGTSIPSSVTSTGGSMYVEFLSDPALRANGWVANYTSTLTTGINENQVGQNISIYPNPSNGLFTIKSDFEGSVTYEITDILGKQIYKTDKLLKGENTIDASSFNKGVYLIKFEYNNGRYVEKLIID